MKTPQKRLTGLQSARVLEVARNRAVINGWARLVDGRTACRHPVVVTDELPAWKNPRAAKLDIRNLVQRTTYELYGVQDSAPLFFLSKATADDLTDLNDSNDPRSNEDTAEVRQVFEKAIVLAKSYVAKGTTTRVKARRQPIRNA